MLSCFNPLSTGHALVRRRKGLLFSRVSIPYLRVTHYFQDRTSKLLALFQSPIYGSRTRLSDMIPGSRLRFNPLSTGHALLAKTRMESSGLCFNPLSTGHAHLENEIDADIDRCFNPLSTGHAPVTQGNSTFTEQGFNPLSTGHAHSSVPPGCPCFPRFNPLSTGHAPSRTT